MNDTRKEKALSRGIHQRGNSFVLSFAVAHGTIERRSLGSRISLRDAEDQLVIFKKAVRDGTYQKPEKRKRPEKGAPTPVEVPVTVTDLWAPYLQNYENEGGRDASRQKIAWAHLKTTFRAVPVDNVTTSMVRDYIALRQGQGLAGGTINRELVVLKAMFQLGLESTTEGLKPMVTRLPAWPKKLEEGAPRRGFVKDEAFAALQRHAKPWLKAFLETAYTFGFRRGELLNLRVGQVDLFDRLIRLDGSDTKTGKPRTVPMTERVFKYLTACCSGKAETDYVFTRKSGGRVVDLRKDWQAACVAAELGKLIPTKGKKGEYKKYVGLTPHDLRRAAIRNMKRRGVSDRVAMEIGGWTTVATMLRYNITDEKDLADAAQRIESGRTVVANEDPAPAAEAARPN